MSPSNQTTAGPRDRERPGASGGAQGPDGSGLSGTGGPGAAPGLVSTLARVPGLLRAWPGKSGEITFECQDEAGRLRAGYLDAQGAPVLLPYATDPALPGLSPDLDGDLVVHRAGRRAVVVGTQRVRKLTRPGRAAPAPGFPAAFSALSAIGLRLPEIIGTGEAHIDLELLPGRSLGELGDAGIAGWEHLAAIWAGLGAPGADLPVHGPDKESGVLRGWFERARLHGVLEGLVDDTRALEMAVEAACADLVQEQDALILCHRDLHDGQLLWTGSELSLIDLDTACLAEAALDLGNLAAHIELMALQGRLSGPGRDRVLGLVEAMASSAPTSAARLRAYRRAAGLRLIFVHAFRPAARAWLPRWVDMHLATHSSSCNTNNGSTSCV